MAIETATYISDLVTTNPLHADGLAQTDSHLRLLKTVLKNTLPNVVGAVVATDVDLNATVGLATSKVPQWSIVLWLKDIPIPAGWAPADGTAPPFLLVSFPVPTGDLAGIPVPFTWIVKL